MNEALRILQSYWGYTQFRSPQDEIIDTILKGKDTLALLPTGGGKSICFQVPGLMREGVCIVISPLIALMKDQVENLKKRGILAEAIYSGMSFQEIDLYLNNALNGGLKFLYVSPERLKTDIFLERFKNMQVSLLAVDEAHCISQWGYDFRPSYLEIATIRELQPNVPILALTASATPEAQVDIMEKLAFRKPYQRFFKSFKRDNISFVVRKTDNKEKKLLDVFKKVPGTAIVYTRSRKRSQELASFLNTHGFSALFYHAGLKHEVRNELQDAWIQNKNRIMVSTNAFGMGIDKPDVRLVVHMDLPENLEAYYQEAGRAGRDGKKSYATVLYDLADIDVLKEKTAKSNPAREYVDRVYTALMNYFQIAMGAGEGESYDFDLAEFSDRFHFFSHEVFHALRKLEENGVLTFNESYYSPSLLHISLDKGRLYEFQVAQARFDFFIKVLLRMYGGVLLSEYVTIQEKQLAEAAKLSLKECVELLQHLSKMQIVDYQPKKDTPQITFLHRRVEAKHLPIDRQKWEARKTLLENKMQAVINYVQQKELCRMLVMMHYFGEQDGEACGLCDVCIDKKKTLHENETHHLQEVIIKILSSESMTIDALEERVNPEYTSEFSEAIRHLLEQNKIMYDDAWKLVLVKD
ncbi:MAG: RecQ family ATP-dependent DNA helicase [Cyclobacteriaceae bacterium]|jgi:ATP-dependent DNA helicase RecQ|nr:RecQ family ATP-dependent DNA helicase [Cyclobacteriaceae bacterium]